MQKFTYVLIIILFIIVLISVFMFVNKPLSTNDLDKIKESLPSGHAEVVLEETMPYLTDEEYTDKVLNYKGKVLIDFYTDWCYYCGIFSPIIEEVSSEKNDIKFYRVNAEEELNIASTNRIVYYPTIVLYENGVEIDRWSGVLPKEELNNFLDGKMIIEYNNMDSGD